MNSQKDSNTEKEQDQGESKKPIENLMSPVGSPKNDHQEHSNLVLRDLTPMRTIYGTLSNQTNVRMGNTDMAIINTPANNSCRNSLLHQIDEPYRQISLIIPFDNQPEISSSEESEHNDFSDSSSKSGDKQENEELISEEVAVKVSEINKQQPQLVIKSEQLKQKQKRSHYTIPCPTNETKRVFCNCKKTKCLKLYCDCFRDGKLCTDGCNCQGCHNLANYEELRNNSMWTLMERNPDAFKPKIQEQKHAKGCNCKKSHCQKKYCQCYQANLKCGEHCRCQQCKNIEMAQHKVTQKEEKNDLRSTAKKEKKFNEWVGRG